MSTTASAVSQPPGLERPRTRPSLETSLYSRGFLLKLASSPLICTPSSLAPLDEWFGDYQPYTPRPNNQQSHQYREHGEHQGHGGMRYNNHRGGADRERDGADKASFARGVPPHLRVQQDDASGPMGEFSHHKSTHHDNNGNPSGAAGSYLSGFQGVRRREGERGGDNRPDRMDKGERHERGYRRHEDRGDGNREGGESPRFANSERQGYQARFAGGKNPFGQLSASGTFRPAGKDGSEHQGRFPMGRMGRNERDNEQSSGALDDNGRPIRSSRTTQAAGGKDFGAGRERGDRRRFPQDFADEATGATGTPTDEDDGTWETVVPRSPDAERKLARAGALADAASDWRRGPGSAGLPKRVEGLGGRGERRGDHRDESRRAGGGLGNSSSASFPAWMADEAETPSWMDDASQAVNNNGSSSSSNHTSLGDRKERGKLNFDAFKAAEIHAKPLEGEDSIQAFKREMKERERRAREQDAGTTSTAAAGEGVPKSQSSESTSVARHPPPGLSKPINPDSADQGNGSMAQRNDQPERPSVNPAESRSAVREDKPSAATANPAAAAAAAGGRGSSRFARFFDETAVTNKVKEAQERAMAGHSQATVANGKALMEGDSGLSRGQSSGLDSLLQGMQMGSSTGDRIRHQDSMPPAQQASSSADNEGMQKIMALLRGGQAAPGGEQSTPSMSTPSSRPQALPASNATSSAAAAGLMAMLSGQRPSPQQETGPSHQHYAQAAALDQRRQHASASPAGMASQLPPRQQSPSYGFRSQSPSVAFQQEQQQRFPGPWNGGAPPPGLGGPPGLVGPDNNMQGYREANAMPTSNLNLPPHLHNQFASLPPHIQHSILSGRSMPPQPGMPPMMHQYHPQPGHHLPHMQYGVPQHLGPYSQQGGGQSGEAGGPPPGLFGNMNMGGGGGH